MERWTEKKRRQEVAPGCIYKKKQNERLLYLSASLLHHSADTTVVYTLFKWF